ncbi:MAG TPA: BlaI/MecI/CopY family transcriptional regulator [Ruminococcaceae bacterium]|jgi:predicted transcriptional regulator|nr:BlaI/MecI/CopY family transcriptional regulator [Oscillospiraceae bacterium]
MKKYEIPESEKRLAKIIWRHEPIHSGELVKLCEKEMQWKKSTTYTILKKLCDKGIFQNQNAVVTSLLKKEEFHAEQSREFIEDTFGGSLPKFIASFIGGKKLSRKEAEELKRLIDEYKEN